MNTVRIGSGEIFFDDFNYPTLSDNWLLVPNDLLRVSLTERPGYLKMYHGLPDLMLLLDEPSENYVLDMRNDYQPQDERTLAGLVVFKGEGTNLEVLEYYDVTKDATFVYEFIRIIKSGSTYTVYARNQLSSSWELIGVVGFDGAQKIGLIARGPLTGSTTFFSVDYIKIYKSQYIQIINLPVGYNVEAYYENNSIINAKKVVDTYKGVEFFIDDIPPVSIFFKIYDESNNLLNTTGLFDVCGGDLFYYGATLEVNVNGNELHQDKEFFLGYYQHSEIGFDIQIHNPYDAEFTGVAISATQYADDLGYQFVHFCLTQDGTFTDTLTIGDIQSGETVSVYGKIIRDDTFDPNTITPYKFNLRVVNS